MDDRDTTKIGKFYLDRLGCGLPTLYHSCPKSLVTGLESPRNREIPPLRYEDVYRLKRDFPHLWIEINGGIQTLTQTQEQLQFVDAVMIGRAAYDHPYLFATVIGIFMAISQHRLPVRK